METVLRMDQSYSLYGVYPRVALDVEGPYK